MSLILNNNIKNLARQLIARLKDFPDMSLASV